ncbi:MAG: polyphosphate polymerase domain-containing protein [Bacteroidales bacterium]|nr:polyphosphate polymerase domain-containing protein [Bacteroidales bacterium]
MNLLKIFDIKHKDANKIPYRYERKFIISEISAEGVTEIIKNHRSFFKEIYRERYINNIYFDTQNLTYYYDNSFGKSQRKKFRIRWYNDLFGEVQNPVLEIKIKNGLLGIKESYPLKSFNINSEDLISELKKCLRTSELPEKVYEEINVLFPVLINRYKRKYFIDFSKKFRATIDSETEYYGVNNKINLFNSKISDNQNVILELKYQEEDNSNFSAISAQFPFRMTKNSKYVNGIVFFYKVSI